MMLRGNRKRECDVGSCDSRRDGDYLMTYKQMSCRLYDNNYLGIAIDNASPSNLWEFSVALGEDFNKFTSLFINTPHFNKSC